MITRLLDQKRQDDFGAFQIFAWATLFPTQILRSEQLQIFDDHGLRWTAVTSTTRKKVLVGLIDMFKVLNLFCMISASLIAQNT